MTASVAITQPTDLAYASSAFASRLGWREITAVGDRMTLVGSNVPTSSISSALTNYPADLLQAPLEQRQAAMTVRVGGPPLAAGAGMPAPPSGVQARGVDQLTQAFTAFVARQHFTATFAVLAIVLSALLGAIHALAPGHGKTVMAAYLVGERGSFRQAAAVGIMVTVTHTAGVLVLGLVISTSVLVAPEAVYPWLGLASGLMLVAIGVRILARAVRRHRGGGTASLVHGHDHHHEDLEPGGEHRHEAAPLGHEQPQPAGVDTLVRQPEHSHGGRPHSHGPVGDGQPMTWGSLLGMGFVGGFLPSPSAVVVLLGAIALGRTWFGVLLVVAYGAGMAATLTGAGLVLLYARDSLDKRLTSTRGLWLTRFSRYLPIGTAAAIIGVGGYLAIRGVLQL